MADSLRCDLRFFSVASILQMVQGEQRNGHLWLESSDHVFGGADFSQGQVFSASCSGSRGIHAFLELFLVPAEHAVFRAHSPPTFGDRRPLGDMLGLLVEGCRLTDEWVRIRHRRVVVDRSPTEDLLAHVGMVPLLAALERPKVLEEACSQAGVARAPLIDPLLRLLDSGFLTEAAPGPPDDPGPDGAFFDALHQGRHSVAIGHLDQAIGHLERAVAMRPAHEVARQNLERARQLATESRS